MRLAAAKEQMAYRDYLLRRLLPAMAASFNRRDADFDAASITTDNVMELHPDLPIVARATISELENRLARYYDRLREARMALILVASMLRPSSAPYVTQQAP